jgi:hypothetical protein
MACLTRCVLSWETNRCEDRPFAVFPIHDSSPLERTPEETQNLASRFALLAVKESHVLDLSSKLVFCSAQPLLETTQKLVLFAVGKHQIIVSQLTVFLFKFAFNFVPAPLHL